MKRKFKEKRATDAKRKNAMAFHVKSMKEKNEGEDNRLIKSYLSSLKKKKLQFNAFRVSSFLSILSKNKYFSEDIALKNMNATFFLMPFKKSEERFENV